MALDARHTFRRSLDQLVAEAGGIEEFCAATEVSFWTVREWQRREDPNPRLDSLAKVADGFDITMDRVVYGKKGAR